MGKINAELIIFDLDGTLVDSKKDIAVSLNETLVEIGLPAVPVEIVYSYVGNGVRPLLEKVLIDSGRMDDINTAITVFRKIYPKKLLETTKMFDGVLDVLNHFQSMGKKMAVASNKPYGYTEKMIAGLDMAKYFKAVLGGDSLKTKKPEPEMLLYIMNKTGSSRDQTVFVGDSAVDVLTGKNSGVKTVGVTYGFRPREEMEQSNPDILIDKPISLMKVIE